MKPLKYDEERVKKRLPLIFFLVWLGGWLETTPGYFMSSVQDGSCASHVFDDFAIGMVFNIMWLLGFLIIPGGVMIYCYARMFLNMRQQSAPVSTDGSKAMDVTASSKRAENLRKVQVNVLQTCAILCLFFICTYTFLFTTDTLIINGVFGFDHDIWNASFISLLLNSCINPFVYTIR